MTKSAEIAQFVRNIDADSFVQMPNVSGSPATGAGNLYYDTADNQMKYYNGTSWVPMGTTVNRYNYTATANQTSFTATYTPGNVDVYLNGTKLTRVTDYTDTSGTAIVLTTGADVGDLIDIVAFSAYSVADTVSASNGGTFAGLVRINTQGDLSMSSIGHPFQIGFDNSGNMAFDTNEIMVRNNGAASQLHLQADAGEVTVNNVSGDGLYVGTKITIGEKPNTTSLPAGTMLHIHKSVSSGAAITQAEAPSIVLSGNETTGAGNQGYHGTYWFGSQDTSTSGDFNWKVAGISSQSAGNDTQGNVATGNLEFYTTNATNNPTNNMTISQQGYVTTPNQPGFMAHLNASYIRAGEGTYINPGAGTWTTRYDQGGWNASNATFTAPISGVYVIAFGFAHTFGGTTSVGDAWSVYPVFNNSEIINFQGFYGDGGIESGTEGQHSHALTYRLAANDTIRLYTSGTSATTITFLTGSYFSVHLLG